MLLCTLANATYQRYRSVLDTGLLTVEHTTRSMKLYKMPWSAHQGLGQNRATKSKTCYANQVWNCWKLSNLGVTIKMQNSSEISVKHQKKREKEKKKKRGGGGGAWNRLLVWVFQPPLPNTCSLTQAGNNGRTVKDRYRRRGMSHEAVFWEKPIGAAPNLNASTVPFASSHQHSSRHHYNWLWLHFPCFHSDKARALATKCHTQDTKPDILTKVSYLLNKLVTYMTVVTTPCKRERLTQHATLT